MEAMLTVRVARYGWLIALLLASPTLGVCGLSRWGRRGRWRWRSRSSRSLPAAISAQVGERISFRVSNKGVLEHNVSIQDPSGEEIALLSLLTKQHGTLQIEPTTPGQWMIICTLPGHEMAGMTATLTVAP